MRKIDSRPNPTAGNLLSEYMTGKINGRPYKGTRLETMMTESGAKESQNGIAASTSVNQ
jgi:hypothetical protein